MNNKNEQLEIAIKSLNTIKKRLAKIEEEAKQRESETFKKGERLFKEYEKQLKQWEDELEYEESKKVEFSDSPKALYFIDRTIADLKSKIEMAKIVLEK